MEYDDDIFEPEGDFILGIYNYCDRWCERCLYTDKCRTFASEKLIMRKLDNEKRLEKSMEENKDFWNQVNQTIEEAAELIDEEIPLVKDPEFPIFDEWDDDDAKESMKDYKEKQEKAKNHNLAKMASKYEKTVHKWFEARKDAKIVYNTDTGVLVFSYPDITDNAELKQLSDLAHVINWYHIHNTSLMFNINT